MSGLRVAVVGAGLGGLCLTQGLVRAGIDVEVYERDRSPGTRRQGYRLHVDGRAALALRACLPPTNFALFLATTGRPGTHVTVLSSRLRVLHRAAVGPDRGPAGPIPAIRRRRAPRSTGARCARSSPLDWPTESTVDMGSSASRR